MHYVEQIEKKLYFKDSYNDFNMNKLINTSKRKLNRKYYIYSNDEKISLDERPPKIRIQEIIRVPNTINRILIIYTDRKNKLAFMIISENKNKTFLQILEEAENKPAHRLIHLRYFNHVLILGAIRYREENTTEVNVSVGYDKTLKYPFKYLLPEKFRKKPIKGKLSKLDILRYVGLSKISLKELLEHYKQTSEINNPLFINTKTDQETDYDFPLKNRERHRYSQIHYLYNSHRYTVEKNKFDIFLRKSVTGQLVFVVTDYLSPKISFTEIIAKVLSKFDNKKYDVYFEKFCNGASESAFELFKYAKLNNDKDAVYILDKNNEKFAELQNKYGKEYILAHNSIKGFIAIFNSKKMISSDLTSHLLRSLYDNSKYIKNAILNNKKKVFLQHGPSLATNIFERGYFNRKVPIAPNYIVTNSEFETNLFQKYPKYRRHELIQEGIPNLDLYVQERNKTKKDITFLLTWRPWDLTGKIETNSYIDRYIQFINLINSDDFYKDKNINIILHPKAKLMLQNQFPEVYNKIESKLFEGDIKDALLSSKIVITDYSSICFYAFAGKSNLVFFWGDKEKAEEEYGSPNILQEENAFGDIIYKIDSTLSNTIKENYEINQREEYIMRYGVLVQYTDGNNTKNVYDFIATI